MAVKGWFLLAIFLLMQAGSANASWCHSGNPGPAAPGVSCADSACCCEAGAGEVAACACAEVPMPDQSPTPVVPPPSPGARDALPTPVWCEVRIGECPWQGTPEIHPPLARACLLPAPSIGTVALTVKFCAFLI